MKIKNENENRKSILKSKIKSEMKNEIEFQNPNLIFENEIKKRKTKMKNNILIAIAIFVGFVFLVAACMIDSDSKIPFIICNVCLGYGLIFIFVNKNYFENIY